MKLWTFTRGNAAQVAGSYMMASTFAMAFQDALIKLVSADLSLWQIFVLRSLLILPVLAGFAVLRGQPAGILPRAVFWVTVRSLLLVAMYVAFYGALPHLPLATAAAAYYSGPLFILLFSVCLSGESLDRRRGFAALAGFAGVLIILRPGTESFTPLVLIPVLSAVFYAMAAVLTRGRCAGESPLALAFVLNVVFVVAGTIGSALTATAGPPAGAGENLTFLTGPWVPLQAQDWAVLIVLGAANLAIHLSLARAYQSGPPATVAVFDYSYLIFAAFWGYLFFCEQPEVTAVAGMLLIALAGTLVALKAPGHKAKARPQPASSCT